MVRNTALSTQQHQTHCTLIDHETSIYHDSVRQFVKGNGCGQRRRLFRCNGFTLIEVLVVIVVLAVLATLVAPSVFQHVGTAKETAARSQIEMIGAALDAYRLDNGAYPTTEQGLEALRILPTMTPPPRNWRGPYLRKTIPMDPWGHAYVYASPGQVNSDGYDLMSHGSDGQVGGEREARDITSW
jgi:general secretion pathway protein G